MKEKSFHWPPEDLDFGQPYFYLNGRRAMYLQNIKKLNDLKSCEIRVRSGNTDVCIRGSGLTIPFYCEDEMVIEGKICEVTLEEA